MAALLVACASDKTATPAASSSRRSNVDPNLVTVRPIVSQAPAPCAAPTGPAQLVPPDPSDPNVCLALGAAGVDASGVADARLIATSGNTVAVDLQLNDAGQRGFSQLAGAHLEEKVAILVNGRIVSTAVVHAPDGAALEIAGLTTADATD